MPCLCTHTGRERADNRVRPACAGLVLRARCVEEEHLLALTIVLEIPLICPPSLLPRVFAWLASCTCCADLTLPEHEHLCAGTDLVYCTEVLAEASVLM